MFAARVGSPRFMTNLSDERWAQAIEEHEKMMRKLRDRDAEGLGQIMKAHIMNKFAAHLKAVEAGAVDADKS